MLVCLGIPDGEDVSIAGAKAPLMAFKEVVIFGNFCLQDHVRTTAEHMQGKRQQIALKLENALT
jgi:hypothetical protein